MNKAQVCEALHINEIQLSRLVKQNNIAVIGGEYDASTLIIYASTPNWSPAGRY